MLNRFLSGKAEKESGPRKRRPYLATECRDLNEADKWRSEILREIGKKVMDIQNAALGEHRLRDLNDEINKLIREKGHWETRIVALGGPNYARSAPRVADTDGGVGAAGGGRGGGYRYFGAAKGLPGVKELFEKAAPRTVRRTRHQMYQTIDADYYGFRDEEDGILQRVEAEAEAGLRARAVEQWEHEQVERDAAAGGAGAGGAHDGGIGDAQFVAHVPLPDSADIESLVLAKKKRDLLAKYASKDLQAEAAEAGAMLGKRARSDMVA
jgi:pre-mRNA-splicing factor ISY1